jgi:hypothetical protein
MPKERFSQNNLPNWMRRRFDDTQRFLMLCIWALPTIARQQNAIEQTIDR